MDQYPQDQELISILRTAVPTAIPDVIATMQAMDAVLPTGDGIKWFNLLYLNVTTLVDTQPPPGGWKDPTWGFSP
jgi:Family of unknown function (DUF5995)